MTEQEHEQHSDEASDEGAETTKDVNEEESNGDVLSDYRTEGASE